MDESLTWCLERLLEEPDAPSELLDWLNAKITARGQAVPPTVELRSVLHLLAETAATGDTRDDTLGLLVAAQMLAASHDALPPECNAALLLPPPDLLRGARARAVVRAWDLDPHASEADVHEAIDAAWAVHGAPEDPALRQQLEAAARDYAARHRLSAAHRAGAVAAELAGYARLARDALGPSLLRTVDADIKANVYWPGQGALAASPARAAGGGARLRAALDGLRAAGGPDPLPRALAGAPAAAARGAPRGGGRGHEYEYDADLDGADAAGLGAALRLPPPRGAPPPLRRGAADGTPGGGGGAPKAARRPRYPWTADEVDALVALCKKHGPGQWAAIVEEGAPGLAGRAAHAPTGTALQVDLKDKWRGLLKNADPRALEVQAAADAKAAAAPATGGARTPGSRRPGRPRSDAGTAAKSAGASPRAAAPRSAQKKRRAAPKAKPSPKRTRRQAAAARADSGAATEEVSEEAGEN